MSIVSGGGAGAIGAGKLLAELEEGPGAPQPFQDAVVAGHASGAS